MWLILFWILLLVNHAWSAPEFAFLLVLTAFQVFEAMQISPAMTRYKFLWNLLRLLLCYLLIGFTGGLESTYYILLFWPIVLAAMRLKPFGTLVFTVLTIGSYLSFLLFIPWSVYHIPSYGVQSLVLRCIAFLILACAVSTAGRASGQPHITA